MTDIATRVYNHKWKIDPIVRSVLDTDFYKLLMAQTIYRRHRAVRVAFGILNRTPSVRLARLIDILRAVNYRGYVALEYEAAENARTAVPRHLEKLAKLLRPA